MKQPREMAGIPGTPLVGPVRVKPGLAHWSWDRRSSAEGGGTAADWLQAARGTRRDLRIVPGCYLEPSQGLQVGSLGGLNVWIRSLHCSLPALFCLQLETLPQRTASSILCPVGRGDRLWGGLLSQHLCDSFGWSKRVLAGPLQGGEKVFAGRGASLET